MLGDEANNQHPSQRQDELLNDPKSTNDVRMIAQEATAAQSRVCDVQRGRLDDRLSMLSKATEENSKSVDEISRSVASLSATVTQLAATVAYQSTTLAAQGAKISDHDTRLAVMTVRVSIAAVIGGSLPSIVQWIVQSVNH